MPDVFVSSEEDASGRAVGEVSDDTGQDNPDNIASNRLHEHIDDNIFTSEEKRFLKKSHTTLSSFCYYPERVRFINEDPKEEVILLLRHHPITNLGWILFVFFLAVVPAFLSTFPVFEIMPLRLQVVITAIWYMFTFSIAFKQFLKWFFHVNIVTYNRLVDVDFHNILYREITDASIHRVQDVTVKIGGGLRTVINYGDVVIQTAAEIPQITFEAVPNPDLVAKVLRELRTKNGAKKKSK